MKYPALPKRVEAPGGAITVVRRRGGVVTEGHVCWGTWEAHTRTIEIDSTAPIAHQWKVFFHELTHAALDDSGLSNGFHSEMEEALCDAIATARFRERFG